MQLLRDNLVSCSISMFKNPANTLQTLWTSSEAEPAGEAAAEGESKDTTDAPAAEEAKPAA